MKAWLASRFKPEEILTVCDANTLRYAETALGDTRRIVFPGDAAATDTEARKITDAASRTRTVCLAACGAGTVHDLTRYAAHGLGLPFVSFPTAASVDGFVSNVAAMTVGGRKITFPSTPPAALFADPDIYAAAPPELTASGVGDIVGKYISLFDWKTGHIITGEPVDDEIYALEEEAVMRVMQAGAGSPGFTKLVMDCLILSGMAIQYMGNSRPASGAEHHLSHLWEMHCINPPTPALHGEKVGVSTLLVLEEYWRLAAEGIRFEIPDDYFSHGYLEPAFGYLTDGIIAENMPDPFAGITPARVDECAPKLTELIGKLPEPEFIRAYLKKCGAKTALGEIGLPETGDFVSLSLRYAPFVRRRLTLLKLTAPSRPLCILH